MKLIYIFLGSLFFDVLWSKLLLGWRVCYPEKLTLGSGLDGRVQESLLLLLLLPLQQEREVGFSVPSSLAGAGSSFAPSGSVGVCSGFGSMEVVTWSETAALSSAGFSEAGVQRLPLNNWGFQRPASQQLEFQTGGFSAAGSSVIGFSVTGSSVTGFSETGSSATGSSVTDFSATSSSVAGFSTTCSSVNPWF